MTKRLVLVLTASLFCGLCFALSLAEGKRATVAQAAVSIVAQNSADASADVNVDVKRH